MEDSEDREERRREGEEERRGGGLLWRKGIGRAVLKGRLLGLEDWLVRGGNVYLLDYCSCAFTHSSISPI